MRLTMTNKTHRNYALLGRNYRQLKAMPELPSVTEVVVGMGSATNSGRVPSPLLRQANLEPWAGLRIELVDNLVLIRQHKPGVRQCQYPDLNSGSVVLSGPDLQVPFDCGCFAAAYGDGFVLLGSHEAILARFAAAPRVGYAKPRKSPGLQAKPDGGSVALDGLLGWRDTNIYVTRPKYGSKTAMLAHSVWKLAGIETGEWLDVERFEGTLVITPAKSGTGYLQLSSNRSNYARMYIGPSLFKLDGLKSLRVLIYDRKVVVVAPDSAPAISCSAELHYNYASKHLVKLTRTHAGCVPAAPEVLVASYALAPGKRVQAQGTWLTEAGFAPGTRYDVQKMEDGVRLMPTRSGAYSVTSFSETPKLYVPAEFTREMRGESVSVLKGDGWLTFRPETTARVLRGSRSLTV